MLQQQQQTVLADLPGLPDGAQHLFLPQLIYLWFQIVKSVVNLHQSHFLRTTWNTCSLRHHLLPINLAQGPSVRCYLRPAGSTRPLKAGTAPLFPSQRSFTPT